MGSTYSDIIMEKPSLRSVGISRAEGLTALDSVIFNREDWDRMDAEEASELRMEAIGEAVRFHSKNCREYEAYCERRNFDPEVPLTKENLSSVPQIPTSVFKARELMSVPKDEIVRCFESSGTMGMKSRIFRDEITLARLSGSLRSSANVWSDLVGDVDIEEDVFVIHLGPSRREAGSVWFGYVMSLIELEADTKHLMKDGNVNIREAIEMATNALTEGKRILVVGAPFLVREFCAQASDRSVRFGSNLYLITGGGWKKQGGKAISQIELAEFARSTLGLDSPKQVRDVFNQVELNSAFIQCCEGRLHAPPWVEVIVRDPFTLEPSASGAPGILTYLDPTARSYPAFIIGEDLGIKEEGPCPCGRHSSSIRVDRRLKVSEHQGCALQLEKQFASVNL
ncbi:acyl-protein synthetase LuxE [Leptospira fluminis]|uniref:Acyl-protein synthetase LuxE n=1 Tax=Leptospira fluminis TaxID=2484979 RepID=A0A4R9GLJ4_9LEPT|nr:acyl-protein synthetase LuxE [Leptospira fluminis]TGK15684.1 acyl-protein synthetase LuxE [Leptospira fluminis]